MTSSITVARSTDTPRALVIADGLVCGASGLILLAGAGPIASFLGLDGDAGPRLLGALLLPYAARLVWRAGRRPLTSRVVLSVALANSAWVVASVAILLAGTPGLAVAGRWALGLAAALVGLFAAAQLQTVRRMT